MKAMALTENARPMPAALNEEERFEWVGLEQGWKRAAILYRSPDDMGALVRALEENGYEYTLSKRNHGSTEKTVEGMSLTSVYAAREKKECERLALLDHHHQNDSASELGMDRDEMLREIGSILGYPSCCVDFMREFSGDERWSAEMERLGGADRAQEIVAPLAALERSGRVYPLLNNLISHGPRLINHFVCRYDCADSLGMAGRVLESMDAQNREQVREKLGKSLVFFTPRRFLRFSTLRKKGERVLYDDMECINSPEEEIERKEEWQDLCGALLEGDSLKVDGDLIMVFRNGIPAHRYVKRSEGDGTLVVFDDQGGGND